ncbi:MAG: protein kinase [Polyangiaceae bacterium]
MSLPPPEPRCLTEATVLALVDGSLAESRRTEVEAHMASCTECRALVSELAKDEHLGRGATVSAPDAGPAPAPKAASDGKEPLAEGDLVGGKYRVLRRLGAGGMGIVLAAEHEVLRQKVALKVLSPEVMFHPGASARFVREARAAAGLASEHVVRVHDVGTLDSGAPYIVMEMLEGRDLATWLAEDGPMSEREAVDVVLQACRGLAEAHARGIIHRDLKPANLFACPRPDAPPLVKILDFGIAKAAEDVGSSSGGLTSSHVVLGSPRYMAPEQIESSRSVDARADIWSLGGILYELVVGKPAFEETSMLALCTRIATGPVPSVRAARPGISNAFDAVVSRCLAKDPEARFPSVRALEDALRLVKDAPSHVASSQAPPSKPPAGAATRTRVGIAVTAMSALFVGLLATWFVARGNAPTPAPVPSSPVAATTAPAAMASSGPADTSTAAAVTTASPIPSVPVPDAPRSTPPAKSAPRRTGSVGAPLVTAFPSPSASASAVARPDEPKTSPRDAKDDHGLSDRK